MTMMKLVGNAALMAIVSFPTAVMAVLPKVNMEDLPKMAGQTTNSKLDTTQWKSLNRDVEYLPVLGQLQKQHLRSSTRNLNEEEEDDGSVHFYYDDLRDPVDEIPNTVYDTQPFVDGLSEYDEYQQAWRLLGFMVDCNVLDGDEWEDNNRRLEQRVLNSGNNEDVTEDGCARYVLWAAYVDLDYEGAGIGEYQYWNRSSKKWDKSACQNSEEGDTRCAKMDCHKENTNFAMLGFFKHRSYDDWMEQLFKHEGMCVWTEEEYAFMKGARKVWPQGCTSTYKTSDSGDYLYYDIKPLASGRITLALYTDSQCTVEYSDNVEVIESIVGNPFADAEASGSNDNYANYDFSDDSLAESMARWEDAFSEWTYCHPCVAFDVTNVDGTNYVYQDDYYNNYDNYGGGRDRRLGGEYDAQGDQFECYDDAGYTNVNQCMKFSAKTNMETATFRDLNLASLQNTISDSSLASGFHIHERYHRRGWQNFLTVVLYLGSLICCLYATCYCWKAERETGLDLDGKAKEFLLRRKGVDKHYEDDASQESKEKSVASSSSGGSQNSKEKPLLKNDHHRKSRK